MQLPVAFVHAPRLGTLAPGPHQALVQPDLGWVVRKGEIIDLDIFIGEIPRNLFGAWLMIEKQGRTYPTIVDPKYGAQPVLRIREDRN
jgi:hypothetical protein